MSGYVGIRFEMHSNPGPECEKFNPVTSLCIVRSDILNLICQAVIEPRTIVTCYRYLSPLPEVGRNQFVAPAGEPPPSYLPPLIYFFSQDLGKPIQEANKTQD